VSRYGGTVALQYEGPDKIEPENLLSSFANGADRLLRNYIESCVALGLDRSTTSLHLDYDHGKGQYTMSWEASK
jgi:hypothetical protein